MKKLIIVLVIIFTCSLCVYAHPGSLDENGGHYNQSTGEYHYHHGYPAHQHTNGKCPYDFVDVRNTESSSSGGSSSSKPAEEKLTLFNVCYIPFWLLLSLFCISHFFEFDFNHQDQIRGCLISLLFIPYLLPPILFSMIVTEFIVKEYNEFLNTIIAVITFSFALRFKYTNKHTVIFGLLTVAFAYAPYCFIGDITLNTFNTLNAITFYIALIIFLKIKKRTVPYLQPISSNNQAPHQKQEKQK